MKAGKMFGHKSPERLVLEELHAGRISVSTAAVRMKSILSPPPEEAKPSPSKKRGKKKGR